MNKLPTIEEAIETSGQSILTLQKQVQSVNDKLRSPCEVQGLLEGQKKILAELEEVKKMRHSGLMDY